MPPYPPVPTPIWFIFDVDVFMQTELFHKTAVNYVCLYVCMYVSYSPSIILVVSVQQNLSCVNTYFGFKQKMTCQN